MKYAVVLAWVALLAGPVSVFAAEKKVPKYEGKPLEYWVERFQKAENEKDREEAVKALKAFGPDAEPAIPALVEMMDDHSEEFRLLAVGIMGEVGSTGKAAIPALVKAFRKDESAAFRWEIIQALKKIGPSSDQMVDVLVGATQNKQIMCDAIRLLGEIGPAAKNAVSRLRDVLKSDNVYNQMTAARALWSIEHDPQIIPVLIKLVGYEGKHVYVYHAPDVGWTWDPDSIVHEACGILGEVGPLAKEAVPQLKMRLNHPDCSVRQAAVEAIRKIDPEEGKKLKINDDGTVTMEGVGKIEIAKPKP